MSCRYTKDFCGRLKKLRQRSGYSSQSSFAKELGIAGNTYASYESRTLLPHKLIPAVCELLNCSPWLLLTGQPGQFSPPADNPDLPLHSTPLIECKITDPC